MSQGFIGTAVGGGGLTNINLSAGTTSNNLSAITFSNGSGISFGLNGSVITATVKTDYQTSGAYLTTAMLSNAVTISNINISAGTINVWNAVCTTTGAPLIQQNTDGTVRFHNCLLSSNQEVLNLSKIPVSCQSMSEVPFKRTEK